MNSYEWPTPNPAPKPTCHWGLDKLHEFVRMRSYEFIRISHLVKYVRIGCEIALIILYVLTEISITWWHHDSLFIDFSQGINMDENKAVSDK